MFTAAIESSIASGATRSWARSSASARAAAIVEPLPLPVWLLRSWSSSVPPGPQRLRAIRRPDSGGGPAARPSSPHRLALRPRIDVRGEAPDDLRLLQVVVELREVLRQDVDQLPQPRA